MRKNPPLLMRSGLTGCIYIVNRYKRLENGAVEAIEKFDVTEQFRAIQQEEAAASPSPVEEPTE